MRKGWKILKNSGGITVESGINIYIRKTVLKYCQREI